MLFPLSRATFSLAGLAALAASVSAEAFERLSAVPDGWKVAGTPAPTQPLRLRIALKQHDVAAFERALIDMSTPGHESYGQHFRSYTDMKELLLPSSNAVSTVEDWLSSAGITDYETDADWVNFRTTVAQANELLDAEFLWYTHSSFDVGSEQGVPNVNPNTRDARNILRTLSYSLPDEVAGHINMVQPTTHFSSLHTNRARMRSRPALDIDTGRLITAVAEGSLEHCNDVITPDCLADLYNTEGYTADAESGSKIGFASFLEQYARYDDLARFEQTYAPHAVGLNFSVVTFNGGLNDQNSSEDSGEANLDLQYIVGVSAPLPVTEYSTGGRGKLVPDLSQPDPNDNSNEPFLEFLQGILKLDQAELPQVISTSYGENEQTIPESYARAVCNLYAQLGSRGVSVLFASGDSGVGSSCVTNDGKNTTHFPPQFPASCPWVTSVGGTNGTAPEAGVFFSSGGFSDLWARPSWQDSAVSSYLAKLGNVQSEYFNHSGRAFPDVAAQATNYAVYDKGIVKVYDGTSCAAPAFSGVVALLNDARLKAGLPVLGFLNPWLYSDAVIGLNDITHGGSLGCDGHDRFNGPPNGSPVIPFASWNATAGWDPVTGLGTPDFEKLKVIALAG
ncbi:peptidase S8/S53 domain-containing protein [Aspergillus granulosus]|uniref:tripeptidyl-peptidase II n=1 Tax=Aspergillus granulosus TaxID=176169 RepID=A0ABR4HT73_9EURO